MDYEKFVELLEEFIETCDLDNLEACNLASKLLEKINDN